ncbi:MAG: MGMT family protein [Clostridiales bacterium]|nr:MGMT family protein [Clostridiales bacterium]
MSFYDTVYSVVRQIPKGKVATYGQIAALCHSPRASRAVGYALHANPMPGVIPCHRVVNREGRLAPAFAFGGPDIQKQLLLEEGVDVTKDYHVPLDRYLWDGVLEEDQ